MPTLRPCSRPGDGRRADGRNKEKAVEPLELKDVCTSVDDLPNWRPGYLPGGLGLAEEAAKAVEAAGIETSLHSHPHQSIGWLHMHAYATALKTRAWRKMEDDACKDDNQDRKNTPVTAVLRSLAKEKLKGMAA